MSKTIWKELANLIDSIRNEIRCDEPDHIAIDFWLYKIERRIRVLKEIKKHDT